MILGIDGKQIGKVETIEIEDNSIYKEATEEQMKTILAMFSILQDHIKEDPLFIDGMPDMTFSVSRLIRVG